MDRYYGVKLYDPLFCNSENLDRMQDCGFNTVFLGRGALSKPFTQELTRRGFFWNIVEPVFLLQPEEKVSAVLEDGKPAEDSWVRFACPTDAARVAEVSKRITADIREFDPPGVSLDFIRFFQFWETTDPHTAPGSLPQSCFCPRCREQQKKYPTVSGWRQDVVTETARRLCAGVRAQKRSVRIGIHCVPWTQDMFDGAIRGVIGQNLSVLSEIGDYLTPMIYHHMMRLETSYVRTLMKDLESQGCDRVLPSVQVKEAYREEKMGPEEFREALGLSLQGRSQGVVLYKWEDLARDSVRLEIARNTLRG